MECSAFFAAMNPNTVTGSCRPWQRRPRLFQDLALFGEDPVLATEPAELLSLVAVQTVAAALTQRLWRNAELGGELRDRLAAALEQLDRLAAELFGYGARMNTDPSRQARRPSDRVSTKAGNSTLQRCDEEIRATPSAP